MQYTRQVPDIVIGILRAQRPHSIDKLLVFLFQYTYLSFEGNSKPSKVQVILGVGLPEAEHFRETNGPGCNV